jgi:acetyl-CoA carboxylase biotin carboxyl carrier protein
MSDDPCSSELKFTSILREMQEAGIFLERLVGPAVSRSDLIVIEVRAELPASVLRLERADGDHVERGDVLMILESMKMEIPIEAPLAGTFRALVAEGDAVDDGSVLAVID